MNLITSGWKVTLNGCPLLGTLNVLAYLNPEVTYLLINSKSGTYIFGKFRNDTNSSDKSFFLDELPL